MQKKLIVKQNYFIGDKVKLISGADTIYIIYSITHYGSYIEYCLWDGVLYLNGTLDWQIELVTSHKDKIGFIT